MGAAMAEPVEDACAILTSLRDAKVRLLTGESVVEVRHRAGPAGVEQVVRYTAINADALDRAIAEYAAKCARANGRPSRFGISTGGRR